MKKAVVILVLVALLGTGLMWLRRPAVVTAEVVSRGPLRDVISASGIVEARSVVLAAKVPARVAEIALREGNRVRAGQVLIRLESDELTAQVSQARAALAAAAAQLSSARELLRVEQAEIEGAVGQAEAQVTIARSQLIKAKAGARAEEVNAAQAQVAQAEAAFDQAERDLRRAEDLFSAGAIPRAQVDIALTAHHSAVAQLQVAREGLALLRSGTRHEDVTAAAAQVTQAERALKMALERSSLLSARRAQVQAAAAQVAQAAASLRAAEAVQRDTLVTAPFGGTVVRRTAEVGELVFPGTPLIEVADLSDRWVSVAAESDDLMRFQAALESTAVIDVTAESYPGRVFRGAITEIASAAERGTPGKEWTVRVKVRFDDPGALLRPGMEADVDGEVILASDVLVVPKDAVVEQGDQRYVFVWNGTEARQAPITPGASSLDKVEVRAGLQNGNTIVISGMNHLRSGHRVSVRLRQ